MRTGVEIVDDGTVLFQSKRVEVPNVHIESVIGEGASGVVFRGIHRYLRRVVAVKVWRRISERDSRDKFRQGMLEAQKAAAADGTKHVVRVHEAGDLDGIFYAVMEYYHGITLDEWMCAYRADLAERSRLAWRIALVASELTAIGIAHGDLHAKNILVEQNQVSPSDFRDFKIVDFGTSFFATQPTFSVRRHWSVLEETINRLTHPFHITRLQQKPETTDAHEIQWWYLMFFRNLPFYLSAIGAHWLERHTASGRDENRNRMDVLSAEVRSELKHLQNSGAFELTPQTTGPLYSWHSLDEGWVEISRQIRCSGQDPAALNQTRTLAP